MITRENLQNHLPQYLTEKGQKKLIEELKAFTKHTESGRFFTKFPQDFLLQGDVIAPGMTVVDIAKREFREDTPCMLVSNTCDMSQENGRHVPMGICYAPVFRLASLEKLLIEHKGPNIAQSFCTSIRLQHLTNYFYLPADSGLGYEGFARLDKICNGPCNPEAHAEMARKRIGSLGQFGHYLFLFKISVHFTRLTEDVERDSA